MTYKVTIVLMGRDLSFVDVRVEAEPSPGYLFHYMGAWSEVSKKFASLGVPSNVLHPAEADIGKDRVVEFEIKSSEARLKAEGFAAMQPLSNFSGTKGG